MSEKNKTKVEPPRFRKVKEESRYCMARMSGWPCCVDDIERETILKELKSQSNVEQTSQSTKKRITSPSSASETVGLRRPVSKLQT